VGRRRNQRRHAARAVARPSAGLIAVVVVLAALAVWATLSLRPNRSTAAARTSPAAVPRPPAADLDPQVAAAIDQAADAVEADRAAASRWGRLGRVYESAEYYSLARACYEEAHRLAPGEAEWSYHLGRLAADRGEPQEAARLLAEVARLEPDAPAPLLRLGDARLRAGDLAGAQAAYAQLTALAPGAPWGRVGMARLRRREGDAEAARRLLEEALAIEPLDREATYLLATLYAEAGRSGAARGLVERFQTGAVAQRPPDPYLDRVMAEAVGIQVTLRRANRLLGEGRLDDAEPLYEEVLAAHPDELAALINLGNLRLRQRDPDGAVALLERAVAQRPEDPHPRFGLALALLAAGRRERGIAELEQVLRLDPRHQQAPAMLERARSAR
jgi:tetratricopeptide (TPR) repeat protein